MILKFETGNWASDPELGVIDTIFEQNLRLIKMLEENTTQGNPGSTFGKQGMPSGRFKLYPAIYIIKRDETGHDNEKKTRGFPRTT